jgi:hypothetical protein
VQLQQTQLVGEGGLQQNQLAVGVQQGIVIVIGARVTESNALIAICVQR